MSASTDPKDPRAFLLDLFAVAIKAADPAHRVPPHLPTPPKGRTIVIGAGKAAAAMARAVEKHWPGPLEGLVVTRYGHGARCAKIEVVEAAHPLPDDAGREAARRIARLVSGLSAQDMVLCLMSGGGSALLSLPAPGLTLADKQVVTEALMTSGATIKEMNCVRKHLSAIKGGRLAVAAAPAQVHTLAISDVPGDDPAVIASGPSVPDPTTRHDALGVLSRYSITAPAAVLAHLATQASETPAPGHPAFANTAFKIIATAQGSLEAAAGRARALGITPVILGDAIEGEAREVAKVHGAIASAIARHHQPVAAPAVILSGGETTVTLHEQGNGRGGRNAEFALALAVHLDGASGIHGLAADTDGIDGSEGNAGAVIDPDTLARARAAGFDAKAMLAIHDSYTVFERLGDLITTGPTLTNVNDFRALYIAGGPLSGRPPGGEPPGCE